MGRKKRLANIELLRALAMMMVVVMHFLRESGGLLPEQPFLSGDVTAGVFPAASTKQLIGTFLEAFCIMAVNAYVFISGYLGEKKEFRISREVIFLARLWFYSLLIPPVLLFFGYPTLYGEMGIYGLVQYLLPIETESYWFATSFFGLMLLQPILNGAAERLTKAQFQKILFFLLLIFCGIKSICPVPLATDRYGYDLSWFVCVYLTAAYLRLYGSEKLRRHGFALYTGSCLAVFGVTMALWRLLPYFPQAAYYYTVPFHYNFVFCLLGAAGLFYGFMRIKIKEGWKADIIRKIGSYSFGIYLFHEHPDLRHLWYPFLKKIINPAGKDDVFLFLAELVFCLVVLYAAGLFLEWIRDILFGRMKAVYRLVLKKRKRAAGVTK